MVHGKSDAIVNYDGKEGGYLSAQQAYQFWQAGNAKKEKEITTVINKDKNDHTSAEIREIKAGDKYITLISIENGGHTWPGTEDFNIGLPIGRTSKEIDFNEYMWEFFNKQ